MADGEKPNTVVPLKVTVDKGTDRVAFAEANGVFVDTLFSFLTMPLGKIVKILRSKKLAFELGCINNLYQSVESLDIDMFQTDTCKTMLLHPQNAAHGQCSQLKCKVDPDWNEPTKVYTCLKFRYWKKEYGWASTFEKSTCVCGGKMTEAYKIPNNVCSSTEGVFVSETSSFLISDELRVIPLSSSAIFSTLKTQGLKGQCNDFEERVVDFKVSELLFSLLFYERPLSYLMYRKRQLRSFVPLKCDFLLLQPKVEVNASSADGKEAGLKVKVLYSKSDRKVLYAEAGADFVDLIFSFLTIPIGAVAKLLGGNSPLPGLNAVYNSINNLSIGNHFKSCESKRLVENPKLAPYFQCDPNLLGLLEDNFSKSFNHKGGRPLKLCNPKFVSTSDETGGGYMRRTKKFMITDDLVVKPLSSSLVVTLLDGFKVPISDVEEQELSVSKREALDLLKSCLKSKSGLTDVFRCQIPAKQRRAMETTNPAASDNKFWSRGKCPW